MDLTKKDVSRLEDVYELLVDNRPFWQAFAHRRATRSIERQQRSRTGPPIVYGREADMDIEETKALLLKLLRAL
jgi:hypothetical protein